MSHLLRSQAWRRNTSKVAPWLRGKAGAANARAALRKINGGGPFFGPTASAVGSARPGDDLFSREIFA
jgi:hypothetical protein